MDKTSPGRLLTAQHREIDQGISEIREGTGDVQKLRRATELLGWHQYVEEEILFPAITEKNLEMPIYILEYEHGQMWPFLARLSETCRKEETPDDTTRDDCRKLLKLFQTHDPKEEDLIYVAADRMAASDPQGGLLAEINSAQVPEGWLCMAQREGFAPPPDAPPWDPPPDPR